MATNKAARGTEWFEDGAPWYPSKWGADDVLGSLNAVTPEKVAASAALVRRGSVYRLSHDLYPAMPIKEEAHGPFFYVVSNRPSDVRKGMGDDSRNKFGAAHCRIEMVNHLGTHLDALNHVAYDNRFYNGVDAAAVVGAHGVTRYGLETIPPVVTRGLLVDVAALHGTSALDGGYAITVEDTEKALGSRGLTVEPGDVVAFHTGWSAKWNDPAQREDYLGHGTPGVGWDLAKWLAARDVALVAADTAISEVRPPELPGTTLPVHQYLIVRHGIRLIDNLKTDELARDGVTEFQFSCAALPIRGATGSPVSPLALT